MINNPQSIPLPEDIQKATEQARNNLTLLDADTYRLTKLKGQLDNDIIKANASKKDLEGSILSLYAQQTKTEKELKETQDKLEASQKELDLIKVQQDAANHQIEQKQIELENQARKLQSDQEVHLSNVSALAQQAKLVDEDKNEIARKKAILADAISKCT